MLRLLTCGLIIPGRFDQRLPKASILTLPTLTVLCYFFNYLFSVNGVQRDSLKPSDELPIASPTETLHAASQHSSQHGGQQALQIKTNMDDDEQHISSNFPWLKVNLFCVLIPFEKFLNCAHSRLYWKWSIPSIRIVITIRSVQLVVSTEFQEVVSAFVKLWKRYMELKGI